MRLAFISVGCLAALLLPPDSLSQSSRIPYNNRQLFLSGGNLAWMSFSNDIGPGPVDYTAFADILVQIHNSGGNAVRWWMHTNGVSTPQFNDTGLVVGPGANTIANLKHALDLAWEREIGMNLCLWSFDMLRSTNSATVVSRNLKLLTDTVYTNAYIRNCLIPMVDSLKGHPGILAWEIFNEPEGMSDVSGWNFYPSDQHVPMAVIQRFVNLCAGAIHRRDSTAKVTNGAWSFKSLTDIPTFPATVRQELAKSNSAQQETMRNEFNTKYRLSLTADEFRQYLQRLASGPTGNYYRDDRLIAAGGDSLGKLDFYEVHYYTWGLTSLSPFHNMASTWGLNKPIVVAEFGITDFTNTYPSFVPRQLLYNVLYLNGYAGALAWSWTDIGITSHSDMLTAIQYLWNNHRTDVDVLGIGVDWPTVTITSPPNNAAYPESTQLTVRTMVIDTLTVDSISFFVANTQWIGSVSSLDSVVGDTSYFTFTWSSVPAGQYSLKAVATNHHGHQGVSGLVQVSMGKPPMMRLEAETAVRQGDVGNISVVGNGAASGGAYLNIKTQDASTTITWTFRNVDTAGNYYVAFGYRLEYATPKGQYINVNGARFDTLMFDGTSISAWYETGIYVPLDTGQNSIQMQLYWGWMDLDYLAVPTTVLTSVGGRTELPLTFSLLQNYPNPFNPVTTIKFSVASSQRVRLIVYDLLGRQVATLVDRKQSPGSYEVPFDAQKLTSGVYFYRIESGSFIQTKKMVLLK